MEPSESDAEIWIVVTLETVLLYAGETIDTVGAFVADDDESVNVPLPLTCLTTM